MITLFQASRRSLLVILPGFALLFAGCAKEAEETSSAGSSTTSPEIAKAGSDSAAGEADAVKKPADETSAASPDLPPLIIPDTPDIPVAGVDKPANSAASHGAWITDFAFAKERAAAENKSILMDFTGSDWCGWCIRLHDEVFDFPEFQEYAEKNLILLELDFPRGKRLPAELVAQNEELQERFGVEGFPTILMLDAEGRPFGRTGYQAGGPAAYVKHLVEMQDVRKARDEALAAADQVEGLEKAKHLGDAISALPEDVLFPSYRPIIDEIVALDAKDEAGLKSKFGGLILKQQLDVKLADVQNLLRRSNDEEEILAEFAKLETEFADYQAGLVQIKLLKGRVYSAFGKFEEVLALATELDQIKDLGEVDRFALLGMKVSAHDQAGRPEKSLEVIDGAVAETKEAQMLMQLYLTKGQLLLKMEKTEEAKAAFALGVERAPEDIKAQVEQYVKRLIPEPPAGTESKPKSVEAVKTPATEEKPAAEAAKPAEKDTVEKEKTAEPEAK